MKRVFAAMLALVLLISAAAMTVSAAPATHKEVKRAIGIVFDNSGSMYIPGGGDSDATKAWCRATYAMEAFATMMNPNDIMQIYPMHDITVGAKSYSSDNPLVITQATASQIREIYTPNPLGTPIETISTACDGLMRVSADERWLIVLTDGSNFSKGIGSAAKDLNEQTLPELETVLTDCSQKVNIMYLGIGAGSVLPQNVSGRYTYYAQKTQNSAEVLSTLSDMCNMIFGRDTLPDVGNTVAFDLSMSKLILFIQGNGIKNVKLGNQSPNSVSDLKYATLGGGGQATGAFKTDDTLQGAMVIYQDVDAGTYDLTYDGTVSSVVCYYEPDVDLLIELLDAAGQPVDMNADLTAGTYTLSYGVVDKYGNKVDSALLGETAYEITYSINGTAYPLDPTSKAGSVPIALQPNDVLDAAAKVTYLDGYTIERSGLDFGWPSGGLHFLPAPAGTLEITVSGGAASYPLSKLPGSDVFRVSFTLNGQACTGEQLDQLERLQATVNGNVSCRLDRDSAGYFVTLGYAGTALETDCGDFTLQVSGIYRNKDDQLSNLAAATADLSIFDDSRQLEWSISGDQSYYQLSKLAGSDPIVVKLTYSGAPLTQAELDGITLVCQTEGFRMLTEPDYENSAYRIRFDPENLPSSGDHKIRITATGVNEIGREATLTQELEPSFGTLPMWLRILIPILLLLLLLLIILMILNQKVLPKGVYVKEMEFNVDGEVIDVKRSPVFDGAGKNKGAIKIYSPQAGNDPFAEQAIFLTVSAISPRRTPSKQRKARVTQAQLKSPQNVIYWKLKTQAYEPDPENPGTFLNTVTGTPNFAQIDIGPTTEVEIQAETDSSSVIFRCKIGFK